MDPDATLQRIIGAAQSGDAEELRAACEDLAEWLERGGFPPGGDRAPSDPRPDPVTHPDYWTE